MALTIKNRIIIFFSAFVITSILVIGVSGVFFGFLIGDSAKNQSSNALTDQIKSNLLLTSEKNLELIENRFSIAESIVNTLASQTEEFMKSTSNSAPRQSYYDSLFTGSNKSLLPSDWHVNNTYNGIISNNYSSWFMPNSNGDLFSLPIQTQKQINYTANLDYYFKDIHENYPEIGWIYVTFHTSKLMRLYPGTIIDESLLRNYDPTIEDWYTDTFSSSSEDVLFSSEPYSDTENGLGMIYSLTKAIKSSTGQKIGVVGLDFTLPIIQQKILSINVLNNTGYASLITRDGIVIAHPSISTTDTSQLINTLEPISNDILFEFETGESPSTFEIQKNNKDFILTSSYFSKGNLVLLIFVPKDKAIEPVSSLNNQISNSTMNLIVYLIILITIFLLISLFVGNLITQTVLRPVLKFTKIISDLSDYKARNNVVNNFNDILTEIGDDEIHQEDEIGDLARSFSSMMKAVKEKTEQSIESEKNFKPDW